MGHIQSVTPMHEKLRKTMEQGRAVGTFSKLVDSAVPEIAGIAGLDFIILDREHGPVSLRGLHDHVRSAQSSGLPAMVRVAGSQSEYIAAALDSGATGIQVPGIETADQAASVVEAARFYPLGRRGVCRFVRSAEYGKMDRDAYFEHENRKLVALQVEGVHGVANIEEILRVEGFDILFVGPYDLSQSLGLPGQVESETVVRHIRKVAAACDARNKFLGAFSDSPGLTQVLTEANVRFLAYSVDVHLLADAFSRVKSDLSP